MRSLKGSDTSKSYPLVTWVLLVGIFFPSVSVTLGGVTLLPGRATVLLLLLPALIVYFGEGRKRLASDYLALAISCSMIFSSGLNDGFRPYVLAESLEFLGAYMIGRAFFFGAPALGAFTGVFKSITVVIIAMALLDTLSGRNVTQEVMGIKGVEPIWLQEQGYRLGLVRARSTFEGYELYGTFCVAAVAIFLYFERKGLTRRLWVGLAVLGTLLSLSSGPFLGLAIVISAFCYDRVFKHYAYRWQALIILSLVFVFAVFLISNNPLGWMVRNLTLDPQTGYFRIAEWEHAVAEIAKSPWIGFGLTDWKGRARDDFMLFVGEQGVDCVWLVEALRYGYPVVILFFSLLVATLQRPKRPSAVNQNMANMSTGLSSAIVNMSLIGLTVHFWDSVWIFFSLCIGIRSSLTESNSHPQRSRSDLTYRVLNGPSRHNAFGRTSS
jgi:hypothetical protein